MRASALLASLHGFSPIDGEAPCFYCGDPADRPLRLSNTFSDWADVAAPRSRAICDGCWISIQEKIKLPGRDKPQKTRNYSWLVTSHEATPFDKGQISRLRSTCLNPPDPPWALSIAVSGQKHLLWRTSVNLQDRPCVVMLETRRVVYEPWELSQRIETATLIAGAIGKPALKEPMTANTYNRLHDALGESGADRAAEWYRESSPLEDLVAFLCPPKEEALLVLANH